MSKNFKDFLNTFSDEPLMQISSQYFPRKNYTDDSEKITNIGIAISKGLLGEYHKWLTENFDVKPKN